MILAFDTTESRADLRGAIHPYDSTARPQVVRREWNPEYYRLLEAFQRRTGRGAVGSVTVDTQVQRETSFSFPSSRISKSPAWRSVTCRPTFPSSPC